MARKRFSDEDIIRFLRQIKVETARHRFEGGEQPTSSQTCIGFDIG